MSGEKNVDSDVAKALEEGVPDELKNTEPQVTGLPRLGAVIEGDAEPQAVVESHKDK